MVSHIVFYLQPEIASGDVNVFIGHIHLLGNIPRKSQCFFSIFKLNDQVNTSVTITGQSLPNYIGSKREKKQACLTNLVNAFLP